MKDLKKLAKILTKTEQKSIGGGGPGHCGDSNIPCNGNQDCPTYEGCYIVGLEPNGDIMAFCKCLP